MGGKVTQKKAEYFSRVQELFKAEGGCAFFVCGIDNVSSQQMHEIRKSLRGEGTVLMGKNSLIRKALRDLIAEGDGQYDDLAKALPTIVENVGIVFVHGGNDSTELLKAIREKLLSNKVAAPARAGAISPKDVWIPAGPTGQDPSKTSFFQALGVPTKIARGTVEISADFQVLSTGQKVGSSEAQLLNMLNISPFAYGMSVDTIFANGQVFKADILDLEEETLIAHFIQAINTIATISLATGYPTLPMVSHSIINHYKKVLALSVATEYTFEGSEQIKDRLANPDAYASAAPAAAAASEAAPAAAAAAEEEEESDEDMGMGLFD